MRVVFPDIRDADAVLGSEGVLAHQGGWDEALVVVVPVALFVLLVWFAIVRQDDGTGPHEDHREGP